MMRKEIDKLETFVVEKDKEIIDLSAIIKQMKNKLDMLTD